MLIKKLYYKSVAKVDNIDTSDFVLKTIIILKLQNQKIKFLILVVFLKKTNYNIKITELENKILDINNLATKTALTARENKIPSVSNLVKKTDYNTKVTEINLIIIIMINILILQSLIN